MVEEVVVEQKVSWEEAELPQLGVVVKVFPPTKLKWIYNNVLMHKNIDVEKATRNICLKWDVDDFGEG
jgi:hypothetical protein